MSSEAILWMMNGYRRADDIQLICNAYREADVNAAITHVLSNPLNVRVVQLWIENHPVQVSHSPMLKDLKNRVYPPLNTDFSTITFSELFYQTSNLVTGFIQKLAHPGLFDASEIESRILSGRIYELTKYFKAHPEELIKYRELIQIHLDLKTLDLEKVLPLLLDMLSTKELTALLSSRVNALPEMAFWRLSPLQILRLSALPTKPELLPPYAQNFMQILQQPKDLAQGLYHIRGLAGITEKEKDAALAHYIEHHKISLIDIKQLMTDAEFLRLAPHLRYVDLQNFKDISLAQELLQKCANLNVLVITNGKMLEKVSSLPLCEKLNCSNCTNLKALPALPFCEKLFCGGCTNLKGLPELPLCKDLSCFECTTLSALPALPLCEELYCTDCINLKALPELPLCKELNCKGCTNLRALPALPLCKTLYCSSCTNLRGLLALPLCEMLYCSKCTNLLELPALPLCKRLNCDRCTNLPELQELPLCEWLNLTGCTNMTTLPLRLGQNAGLTTIDITGTHIDPAVRDAILNQCRLMRNAEAANILPSRLAKWKAIAKSDANLDVTALSVEQKITLNEWLLRLERTKDFSHAQSLLANTVCQILTDLVKKKEFQELFFPQAEANNACCEDRAAMSLNEIYTSWMAMCKSWDLHMLTGVAKTLCLRKELQKLIGDERESVEMFLYYETTLRERLGLVTAIQNMTYGEIGKREWINEDKLVEDVEAHFFDELFELPVFEKRIVFDDSQFADKLEALGECPKGDPNDPQVLNFQHRQGEIMQEWKREKKRAAKQLL